MFLDGFELYMAGGVMAALIATGFSTMAENAQFCKRHFLWNAYRGMVFRRPWRSIWSPSHVSIQPAGLRPRIDRAFVTPNIQILVVLRFIMGLGLGAEVVCSFAMLSEFVPPQARGRAVGWLALLTNGPLLITGFMNVWIIPLFGWR